MKKEADQAGFKGTRTGPLGAYSIITSVQYFLCKCVHLCLHMLIAKSLGLVYILKAEADASLHCHQVQTFKYLDHV